MEEDKIRVIKLGKDVNFLFESRVLNIKKIKYICLNFDSVFFIALFVGTHSHY